MCKCVKRYSAHCFGDPAAENKDRVLRQSAISRASASNSRWSRSLIELRRVPNTAAPKRFSTVIVTALAFQYIGGYQPCPLCLQQRWAYYAAIPALFVGADSARRASGRIGPAGALLLLISLAFLANAALGIYHAGAEWKFWPGPDTAATTTTVNLSGGAGGDSRQARCRPRHPVRRGPVAAVRPLVCRLERRRFALAVDNFPAGRLRHAGPEARPLTSAIRLKSLEIY